MSKMTYDEIYKIRDEIGDHSRQMSLRIKEDDWSSYIKAMNDLQLTFSGLIKHIVVSSEVLHTKVLKVSPVAIKKENVVNSELEFRTRNRTVQFSAVKVYFMKKYFKAKKTNLRKLCQDWLEKHKY